ncbi:MAG: hypothetical protein ACLFUO_06980 [Candidatus Woesearchaeota archaeon]
MSDDIIKQSEIKLTGDIALLHYKGVFDLQGLYKMMRAWFADKQYDFYETLHKAKPPELELEWVASRKVSGYIKHFVYIEFHFWGLHDIEAVVDGVKKPMNEGRFTLKFDGEVKTDYEGSWEEERSSLRAKMKYLYENYIIKKDLLLNDADLLVNEIRALKDKTKDFLGMEGV